MALKDLQDLFRPQSRDAGNVKESPNPSSAAEPVVNLLARFVRDGTREERIGAAYCIAHFVNTPLRDYMVPPLSTPRRFPHSLQVLPRRFPDNIPEVQRDLLKAVSRFQLDGDELISMLVTLLSVPQDEVQEAAVAAISTLGVNRAWTLRTELVTLLDAPPRVAIPACDTLAWLGPESVCAVPKLVNCILNAHTDRQVRIAATRALVAIDPRGKALSEIRNRAERDTIIAALSHLDQVGRQLRQLLPRRWAKVNKTDPGEWMSLPQIAERINCPERTLRRRIQDRTLCPRDKRGAGKATEYLITRDDLKRWRIA